MKPEIEALLAEVDGNVILAAALACMRLAQAMQPEDTRKPKQQHERYMEDVRRIGEATRHPAARPDLEVAFLQATEAPHIPLEDVATAPMPMADAVKMTMPSFADLQEGDWVHLRVTSGNAWIDRKGFVRSYDGEARLLTTDGGMRS